MTRVVSSDSRLQAVQRVLVCPSCQGNLLFLDQGPYCSKCRNKYLVDKQGYPHLVPPSIAEETYRIKATDAEYAESQHYTGRDVFVNYLKLLLQAEPYERVLEVGCGAGEIVNLLRSLGIEAYGVDLPDLSPFWANAGNDPGYFFCSNAVQLPFKNDYFNVVYSLGVIEHIGTVLGNCTLADNYKMKRRSYAREIVRVTKPGGRIVIAAPNKSFPIDIKHGPTDSLSPRSSIRSLIFKWTEMNFHRTWGKYRLLSYAEVESLFIKEAGGSFEPLPLAGYFGFGRLKRGFLKMVASLAEWYVNNLPKQLRPTFLNPYLLVQIRK